jgi:hypothetical protein
VTASIIAKRTLRRTTTRVAIAGIDKSTAIILGDEPTGDLELINECGCYGSFPNQQSQPANLILVTQWLDRRKCDCIVMRWPNIRCENNQAWAKR